MIQCVFCYVDVGVDGVFVLLVNDFDEFVEFICNILCLVNMLFVFGLMIVDFGEFGVVWVLIGLVFYSVGLYVVVYVVWVVCDGEQLLWFVLYVELQVCLVDYENCMSIM